MLKNLTPHPITILDENNNIVKTYPSVGIVRLSSSIEQKDVMEGVRITCSKFGVVQGLPHMQFTATGQGNSTIGGGSTAQEAADNFYYSAHKEADCVEITTYYIVSQMVKNALPNRADLLVPSEVQRNSEGVVIGCRSLGL